MLSSDIRIGPYRIIRLIRRGGQGSVYLGYDQRLRRRVAIKIRPLPKAGAVRRRTLREARAVANIQSTKVVQVYDVIESTEHLALVMEYVPGCDLEEFLASTQPSLASILTIGADIAGALAAARQQHIVHGDLKAGNVLISDSGRAKLTDFGIARDAREDQGQAVAGSHCALSPEQYLGEALDVRSDLFALGCLLYRMLTGEHPYYRGGQLDTGWLLRGQARPVRDLVPQEQELPGELEELVSDLIQPAREDRPENTHSVRRVLRRLSREIPLAASNSLLLQARPLFRHESVEDIPPMIPAGFGHDARSRLAQEGAGVAYLRDRLAALGWSGRLAGGLLLLVLLGVPLTMLLRGGETLVYLHEPRLRVEAAVELPLEVSMNWLLAEAKNAVVTGLGEVHFAGPGEASPGRILAAGTGGGAALPQPQESLQLELRCLEGFCVFAAGRKARGQLSHQQAVLFPDMPLRRWREVIRDTTLDLYR